MMLYKIQTECANGETCLNNKWSEMFGIYTPGNTVFTVRETSTQVTCEYCNGTGKVEIIHASGSDKTSCPKCYGGKTRTQWNLCPAEGTIDQVGIILCSGRAGNELHIESVYLVRDTTEHDPKIIFATAEECQAYIDSSKKK